MQSAKQTAQEIKNTFQSGQPGTTGREVFENSTATGPGTTSSGASSGVPAEGAFAGAGQTGHSHGHGHGHHGHEHGSHGTGLGATKTGLTGTAGLGNAGTTGNYENTGSNIGGAGAAGIGSTEHTQHHGEHHHHHHQQQHHQGQGLKDNTTGEHGNTVSGVGATGAGIAGATGQQGQVHSHLQRKQEPVGQDELARATGGMGHGSSGISSSGNHTDRVGNRNENAHLYERTGADGPATTGAAGTDRFDTDKSRLGSSGVGVGAGAGTQPVAPTGTGLPEGQGGEQARSNPLVNALTTSDKEFTNSDRLGKGAYHDSSKIGANSALTDRDVTRAESRSTGGASGTGNAAMGGSNDVNAAEQGETTHKKGIVEKIKDVLS